MPGKPITKTLIFVILPTVLFLILYGLHIRPEIEYSKIVYFRDGSILKIFLTSKEYYRYYLPLEDIDPLLVKAILCHEDKRFFYHPGVDPFAVARAVIQNFRAGRIVSGASTITLQLIRLLNPAPRTYKAKILEALKALSLETVMKKKKILETYLNLAPFGGNIEGVGAASLYYFGKLPRDLDITEIAFLVSLPQSPENHDEHYRIASMRRVIKRMAECGLINNQTVTISLSSLNSIAPHKFPRYALHAAEFLKARYPEKNRIFSTIDKGIQTIVEKIVESHRERLVCLGAHQISVVVISNGDRSVKALIGSMDYLDKKHSGQIKGFNIRRSTGSTLKPFLYALALQSGTITPETKLQDTCRTYGSFKPVNFNSIERKFVKAKEALRLSLNLPFVKLMDEIGSNRFYDFLHKLGCKWDKNPGLSAITGGIETTLLQLTNMYTSLARGGKYGNLRFLRNENIHEHNVIHPGAAFLTLEALKVTGFPFELAIKTGTSFGRRDAWAIGVSPNYTVGVWVGNFNGRGSRGIVGAQAALPVLKDIMNEIEQKKSCFTVPVKQLKKLKVCPDSGLPVSPNCPRYIYVKFPEGIIPPSQCRWHKIFMVEGKTGFRVCPFKKYPVGSIQPQVFFIPPWSAPPSFGPDCPIFNGKSKSPEIHIVKPVNMRTYFVAGNSCAVIPIRAKIHGANRSQRIFWFVNGKFKAITTGENTGIIRVPFGPVEIEAITEKGSWHKIKVWILNRNLKTLDTAHSLPYSQKFSGGF